MWDDISYCGRTIEVWEWMRTFTPIFIMDVITYAYRDSILSMLVKRVPGRRYILDKISFRKGNMFYFVRCTIHTSGHFKAMPISLCYITMVCTQDPWVLHGKLLDVCLCHDWIRHYLISVIIFDNLKPSNRKLNCAHICTDSYNVNLCVANV